MAGTWSCGEAQNAGQTMCCWPKLAQAHRVLALAGEQIGRCGLPVSRDGALLRAAHRHLLYWPSGDGSPLERCNSSNTDAESRGYCTNRVPPCAARTPPSRLHSHSCTARDEQQQDVRDKLTPARRGDEPQELLAVPSARCTYARSCPSLQTCCVCLGYLGDGWGLESFG